MLTYFIFASDESVTVDLSKLTKESMNSLRHSLSFDQNNDLLSISTIVEFGQLCTGKLCGYLTPELKSALTNVIDCLSDSVNLFFFQQAKGPFAIAFYKEGHDVKFAHCIKPHLYYDILVSDYSVVQSTQTRKSRKRKVNQPSNHLVQVDDKTFDVQKYKDYIESKSIQWQHEPLLSYVVM